MDEKRPYIDPEEIKQIAKEAYKEVMKEFLDEKFATFGRWAAMSFAALIFAAFIYFILFMNGWQRGPA